MTAHDTPTAPHITESRPTMLKLYHSLASVCSIKVRLGLAEIGLEYEGVLLDLSKGEQHTPEYLALNPNGVIPTLVDDDLVLGESSLIVEYLDRNYNESQLMPTERVAEAQARQWLLRTLGIHAAINTLTFSTEARDKIRASNSPEQIEALIAKMPDPVSRLKRADLLSNGLASPYVGQAFATLRRTFVDIEEAVGAGSWVTGPEFGIADVVLVSYIDRLEVFGYAGLWSESAPKVGEWLARCQARPSYQVAVTSALGPDMMRTMRKGGEKHWPALGRMWSSQD